ncbi:IS5 family transposase IS1405 [Ralstonia mannitolilytica]|uniref:IS5 family transposase IS1405 n=1 Tax=Ralstonia mannitolilytica TaxID=105219 RepID=A0ABM9L252_9RALS|nr:IS5 family transposase IS1405 [Ralstonia mannitolilytica]CAJ0898239.1 IS5 family transposase IS1405 [Ralstonia mannitolilytica]
MRQADLRLDLTRRKTRKAVFLDEMERVMPWAQLLALIEPHAPLKDRGRPEFAIEVLLRIHFLQYWFGLSDMAMEEALSSPGWAA